MVFQGLFHRLGQKREEPVEVQPDSHGDDGWVELVAGRVVVHDPAGDGRYATLAPDPGVNLWINGEEVDGPTAVAASDDIRYEVLPDVGDFLRLDVSEDQMTVTMTLTADPHRLPDTVALVGEHQARIQPGYSAKARTRSVSPREVLADRLKELGVVYGISEAAVEKGLSGPIGVPLVIARGQEPQEPVPGHWEWRLDQWSLVDAGQVIAVYQGGRPNLPRITVRGEMTKVHEDEPGAQVYLAGNGTRILGGDRLVASTGGRARAVPTPQGLRVHIFPVERLNGDLEGPYETKSDLIVQGNLRAAKVRSGGEVLVAGSVDQSEIHAEAVTVRGEVADSRIYTIPRGHFLPLRAELAWVRRYLESIQETVHHHSAVKEESFREAQHFVRALRRKAEQISIEYPDYLAVADELARVFMGAQAASGLDAISVDRLLAALAKLKQVEETTVGGRDVRARSLVHATVWAGRDILVKERVANSFLACGGSVRTPEEATLSQSELVAGEEVTLGVLASLRGTAPVVVRAGGRMLIDRIQPGCALEFGADRKEFKTELDMVAAIPNARGQLIIRQRD